MPIRACTRIVHERVTRNIGENFRQFDRVGEVQKHSEDLSASDDGYALVASNFERFAFITDNLGALSLPVLVACEDDMTTAWKQARKALEGLASHHHRGPHGQHLKSFEIGRNMPGKLALPADYSVTCTGDHNSDGRLLHLSRLPLSRGPAKGAIARP